MEGNPPSYLEFANFWEEEYQKRKNSTKKPKKEWAYICFLQRQDKSLSAVQMKKAWEKHRKEDVKRVIELLKDF